MVVRASHVRAGAVAKDGTMRHVDVVEDGRHLMNEESPRWTMPFDLWLVRQLNDSMWRAIHHRLDEMQKYGIPVRTRTWPSNG